MSQDEMSRLLNDVMSSPAMAQEAMAIADRDGMEAFIAQKGYELSADEMNEVWEMAVQFKASM